MLPHERGDLPGVNRFPRHLGGGVVAAGEPDDVQRKLVAARFGNRFVREVDRKC